MKRIILKTALPLLAVALIGMFSATSCEKEHKQITAKGYFVQLKSFGGSTPIQEPITAFLLSDTSEIPYPSHIIVGDFACQLPNGYVKGDTILAETILEQLYPIEGEDSHAVGPYYKLLNIKKVKNLNRHRF